MLSVGDITKFCLSHTPLERVTWASSSEVDFYLDYNIWIFGINSIGVHDHDQCYSFINIDDFIEFLSKKGVPVSTSKSNYEQLRLF